ncbi:hypothetical protein ASPFODRAFT_230855 [Aspergillus luchuensis CBS 106.47]|uniref:Uncharacterized protein n=1 Tax=Aspergillus luchuensis (strain CBS 106.47) TaxID=1137211 RepID=A0A1M3TY47_ASPLC|nr:hypothetical protein ASPFODRAFT_230855 [Aspergillus luchuensis CBS 106.47]
MHARRLELTDCYSSQKDLPHASQYTERGPGALCRVRTANARSALQIVRPSKQCPRFPGITRIVSSIMQGHGAMRPSSPSTPAPCGTPDSVELQA